MSNIQICNIGELNIAYRRKGNGEQVLLIHGITTYSFIWDEIFSLLTPNYDVTAVDLLGCGDSDKPLDVDYSIKNQANIIAKCVEKLELQNVHLVAHDIGGGVAQILAVKYPQLFKDVTLINSVAYDFWPVQPITIMRTPIIRQFALATLDMGAFELIVKRGLYKKEVLTKELMAKFWEPMKTRVGRKAFLHLAEDLDNKNLLDITDDLHKLETPFLIIRAENDVYLRSDISEKLNSNIKNSKLIVIPKSGHFMLVEVPKQIVEALTKFFGEH